MNFTSASVAMVMYGLLRMRQAVDKMTKRKSEKPPAKSLARLVKVRIAQAAKRALAEAEARRQTRPLEGNRPPERGGQPGPEPTRYGDWEKKGIISDF